jgi:hypothetical protein
MVFFFYSLGGVLFVGYKYFRPGSNSSVQSQTGGPPQGALVCDVEAHSCKSLEKTASSGTLKVILTAGGKAVPNLEVDVSSQPGGKKYYMRTTDASGASVFDGIPSGNSFIYFNTENFPQQFGTPPTAAISVFSGQTVEKSIDLISKQ